MIHSDNIFPLFLGLVLILSSLGVILAHKPVHSCIYFLLALIALAGLYLQLSAEFIAVMQVLVYAGAILVIFMFVVVLFQDAYLQINLFKSNSSPVLLYLAGIAIVTAFIFTGIRLLGITSSNKAVAEGFGMVESLGRALYVDYFFPFEAVILLFLVALIGALYTGRKET